MVIIRYVIAHGVYNN